MEIKERAKKLRKTIEEIAQSLDDTKSAQNVELFPEWEKDKSYKKDEKIKHCGILYKVLQDHTSQMNWLPPDAVSLYTKVLIPDPGIIPDWEQPLSTNPYMKGDKVKHKDKTWISEIDNNVWEPGIYGWKEI